MEKNPASAPKKLKKPPCRRRRRRSGRIAQTFAQRQVGKHWLSTHLWHAKRTRMEDLWGYRLAVRLNEKRRKACIRASQHGCLLYDRSYYEVLLLLAPPWQQLATFISPQDLEYLQATGTVADPPPHRLRSLLFRNSAQQIVGPVEVIAGPHSMVILAHPCITSSLATCLAEARIHFTVQRGEWAIFDTVGPQTGDLIRRLIRPHLSPPPPPTLVASGAYTGWAIDPRFAESSSPSDSPLQDPSPPGDFWNIEWQQDRASGRKTTHQLDQLRTRHAVPGTPLLPTDADPRMPLCLVQHADGSRRSSLIVHRDWGMIVWRTLVFGGAHVAALEEMNAVDLEQRQPVFPQDYPMASEAFTKHLDIYATRLEEQWTRTPPAKRINYERLGMASPFRLDLGLVPGAPSLERFQLLWIEMDGRGTPHYNARIYQDGQLVGLVTSGGYSQVYGKGIGMAACSLPPLPPGERIKVQVQNTNSSLTRTAYLCVRD